MLELLTADWHLTDKVEDEYRWHFVDWLTEYVRRNGVDRLWILGDITDRKDRHSSTLVNRVVHVLRTMTHLCPEGVGIVVGNHDYVKGSVPFFKFLDGDGRLRVFDSRASVDDGRTLIVPHTSTWSEDWEAIAAPNEPVDLCLFHQCLFGASVGGTKLEGADAGVFACLPDDAVIVGGDIHDPQRVGRAFYAGAPYPVKFGDDYEPRVLLYMRDEGKVTSVKVESIRKISATVSSTADLDGLEISQGDQVKLNFTLRKSDLVGWDAIKQDARSAIQNKGGRLVSFAMNIRERRQVRQSGEIVPCKFGDALKEYCEAQNVDDDLFKAGRGYMDDGS